MKTKKILARHSKTRAKQRYGVDLNRADRKNLVQQIQSNKARFIQAHSRRVKEFVVKLEDGTQLRCLYDNTRNTIITFLPPEDSDEAKKYRTSLPVVVQ